VGRIIDPTKPQPAAPTLEQWLTAFTCIQECSADAADNSEIRRSVSDNVKMLRARVKENADPQAERLLASQELIQRQMFAQRPEISRLILAEWRIAMVDIRAYCWDLTQPVHYHEGPVKGGVILFWQGDAGLQDNSTKTQVSRRTALMAIKFLKFVKAMGEESDPIKYTQQMLEKQGITADNFHLYADQLAFPNPWTAQ